jgi:hypothetical protein
MVGADPLIQNNCETAQMLTGRYWACKRVADPFYGQRGTTFVEKLGMSQWVV